MSLPPRIRPGDTTNPSRMRGKGSFCYAALPFYSHMGSGHRSSRNQPTIPAHPEDIVTQNAAGYSPLPDWCHVTSDGVGDRTPETTIPRGVDLACMPKMPPVEIGPERVEKDKLRISRLPEQEIG